jgi:hypothetical protein
VTGAELAFLGAICGAAAAASAGLAAVALSMVTDLRRRVRALEDQARPPGATLYEDLLGHGPDG